MTLLWFERLHILSVVQQRSKSNALLYLSNNKVLLAGNEVCNFFSTLTCNEVQIFDLLLLRYLFTRKRYKVLIPHFIKITNQI